MILAWDHFVYYGYTQITVEDRNMAHCRKTQLSILLNTACNLNCVYCYSGEAKNDKQKLIDVNFVKRAILDFFAKQDDRQIRFFSVGEPTLAMGRIKEITQWVNKITDKKCKYELQTNGFFSDEIANWVSENMDIVWISCDGPPEIQDYYRPNRNNGPSSLVVEKNIRLLASSPITLGCRATIGKFNVYRQKDIIEYFASLGVKAVMSDPIFASVTGSESKEQGIGGCSEYVPPVEYAKYFLGAREYAEKKGVFYGSMLTVNFDEKTEYFCRACIPYPHLTPDGFVSCCSMGYNGTNKKMQDLIYGKYIQEEDRIEYDQSAISTIRSRKASNMEKCQGCEVLYNCAGGCLGEALNETGSMFGIKPEICEAIRYLAKHVPLNKGLYKYLHP